MSSKDINLHSNMYSLNYSSTVMVSSIPAVVGGDKCYKSMYQPQGISELTLWLLVNLTSPHKQLSARPGARSQEQLRE